MNKNQLKLLVVAILLILTFGAIKVYATTPSIEDQCGDGVCDNFEKQNLDVCPQDCSNIDEVQNQSVRPNQTAPSSPAELSNLIIVDSFKIEVKNDLVIFGFTTQNKAASVIEIKDSSDNNVKNLELFSTGSLALMFQESDTKGFPAPTFKLNHYYLIKNLTADNEYKITTIVSDTIGYYEKLTFDIKTSSSQEQEGTYKIGTITTTSDKEFNDLIGFVLTNNYTNQDNIGPYCEEYKIDTAICDSVNEAKKETGFEPKKPEEQGVIEQTTAFIKTTLADKFFNNKIVFYGDMAILALLLLLEIIYLLRSRNAWGLVFDTKNKKPLQGAIVRVFSDEYNKLVETKVTDTDGRFSFLVKPGNYYLEVTKQEYRFPSKLITKRDDEFYRDMYRGEVLHIFKSKALLNPNIPMDQVGESSTIFAQTQKELSSFAKKLNYFIVTKLRIILLVLVTILNISFIIIAYVPPLMAIGILVVLIWLLEGYAIFKKGYR